MREYIPDKYYKDSNPLSKLLMQVRQEIGKKIEYYCV